MPIAEMGSNSNGTYVKWENGLMVCWDITHNADITMSTRDGAYVAALPWTYPAAFAQVPAITGTVTLSVGSTYNMSSLGLADAAGASSCKLALWSVQNCNKLIALHLFAIGKWK